MSLSSESISGTTPTPVAAAIPAARTGALGELLAAGEAAEATGDFVGAADAYARAAVLANAAPDAAASRARHPVCRLRALSWTLQPRRLGT